LPWLEFPRSFSFDNWFVELGLPIDLQIMPTLVLVSQVLGPCLVLYGAWCERYNIVTMLEQLRPPAPRDKQNETVTKDEAAQLREALEAQPAKKKRPRPIDQEEDDEAEEDEEDEDFILEPEQCDPEDAHASPCSKKEGEAAGKTSRHRRLLSSRLELAVAIPVRGFLAMQRRFEVRKRRRVA